jgi:hypothetical protein
LVCKYQNTYYSQCLRPLVPSPRPTPKLLPLSRTKANAYTFPQSVSTPKTSAFTQTQAFTITQEQPKTITKSNAKTKALSEALSEAFT